MLFGPVSDLLALIKETPAASHVVADASDQRAGIISTLQIALRGFRFLPPESDTDLECTSLAGAADGLVVSARRRSRHGRP